MKKFELLIPPPIISVIVMIIQYAMYKLFPICSFYWVGNNIVSTVLILIGLSLAVTGIITFKKHSTTTKPTQPELSSKIVSSGVYKISRNPMYLGILFGLLGIGFYFGNIISILTPLLFFIYITQFQIKPEERILKKKFVEDYRKYISSTRRWI